MILDKIFKNSKGEYVNLFDVLFGKGNTENYIYTLAEAHAIDLIARTIAKCEIQTFELKNGNIDKEYIFVLHEKMSEYILKSVA